MICIVWKIIDYGARSYPSAIAIMAYGEVTKTCCYEPPHQAGMSPVPMHDTWLPLPCYLSNRNYIFPFPGYSLFLFSFHRLKLSLHHHHHLQSHKIS
uniref:Uncharacterized protein n=1 Tax=Nelumbo nucifera TaxID=4432 RepID=A0A822XKA4_NELNU|nr:TPA_asm: hypothetical protein HUJ06_020982 [Nelumbo nucifera]